MRRERAQLEGPHDGIRGIRTPLAGGIGNREIRVRYDRGFSIAGAFGQSEISRLDENEFTRSLEVHRTHAETAPFNARLTMILPQVIS